MIVLYCKTLGRIEEKDLVIEDDIAGYHVPEEAERGYVYYRLVPNGKLQLAGTSVTVGYWKEET